MMYQCGRCGLTRASGQVMGLAMPQCQCAWEFNPPVAQTPPQHTWVGLTDEDIEQEFGFIDELLRDCVQRTEAKLKEKNNG